MAKEGHASL